MRSARAWIVDHRFTIGAVLLVLAFVAVIALILREVERNEDQDAIDRDRTVQVEDILHQLAGVVARQDADRVQSSRESCERGNDIRRSVHNLAVSLTDDPDVIAAVDEEFALVDCRSVVSTTPTTPGGSHP